MAHHSVQARLLELNVPAGAVAAYMGVVLALPLVHGRVLVQVLEVAREEAPVGGVPAV